MTLLRFDKVATSRAVTTWTATANGLTVSIERTCRRAGRVFYAWSVADACGDTVDGGNGHDWTMCRRAARLAVERTMLT